MLRYLLYIPTVVIYLVKNAFHSLNGKEYPVRGLGYVFIEKCISFGMHFVSSFTYLDFE